MSQIDTDMLDIVARRKFKKEFENLPSRLQNFDRLNKEQQLEVLKETTHPWSFEIDGSKYLNDSNYSSITHSLSVLNYPEISSISNRNKNKISVLGNQYADIENLIKLEYLKKEQEEQEKQEK